MPSWLHGLGASKLTVVLFVLLGLSAAVEYLLAGRGSGVSVVACGLLFLNLSAAFLTQPKMRSTWGLALFHLCIGGLLVLGAASRLTYLKAGAELTDGADFSGLKYVEGGPWHAGAIERVRFRLDSTRVEYLPGPQRQATITRVTVYRPDGRAEVREVSDGDPLVLHNYRFLPTQNKGFAPVFLWQPDQGAGTAGSVHLPAYPAHADAQFTEWAIPRGPAEPVLVSLLIDETVLPEDRASVLRPPQKHRLAIRLGDVRHELRPGDSVALPGGRLHYLELRLWMGYQVFYDWTIPWMLATTLLAVVFMGLHFWTKFARRPWDAA